jgi:diamine N-acetyltransferase
MIPLLGEHIKLRAIEPSDLDDIFRWENDPDNWLISNTSVPFSRHILKQYIENAHRDIYEARQLRLMIVQMDEQGNDLDVVGTIDLFDFEPMHQRAGIGILIAKKEKRKQGLASEALEVFTDYAFSTLHLHQLYCNILSNNQDSLNLFRKHGFTEAGQKKHWIRKRNEWLDVVILQKIAAPA